MLNLKQLREEKGVSQATVARELNISRQTYNNYELGKREADYETLLKLAEYFGTSVDCLISNRINDNFSSDEKIKDPDEADQDLVILNRNAKKLSPENRKKLLDMAKVMFKEEFNEN
ncbi:helix-turn-helix domain-containing protein [Ruminococcus flavefaciens]|uniref:helix-turn-helix domain-containing protein n=1 Tax=Ruminococcus flavefaciens TaxID=1265 RepID=UPI0026EAAAC4|nr:helix-turn-helix transcriptional regulator [Ruminococcus flavefaciens]